MKKVHLYVRGNALVEDDKADEVAAGFDALNEKLKDTGLSAVITVEDVPDESGETPEQLPEPPPEGEPHPEQPVA